MEFVRHRVESIFTDPIRLLLKGCSIEARNRPRITKTGISAGSEEFSMSFNVIRKNKIRKPKIRENSEAKAGQLPNYSIKTLYIYSDRKFYHLCS